MTYAHAQADTHGSGEVWVQLLAEVTNTGSEPLTLGAADWTVCTPDGTELAVRKGVSAYPQTIEPGERCVFPSGLAAEIPAGTAGFVFTRSGLGIKKGIHVTNGVVAGGFFLVLGVWWLLDSLFPDWKVFQGTPGAVLKVLTFIVLVVLAIVFFILNRRGWKAEAAMNKMKEKDDEKDNF